MTQAEIRPYRLEDAPQIAQLYFDSVHALGTTSYSQAQVRAWAPAPVDPAAVHALTEDGRTTLVAAGPQNEVLGYGDLEADAHIDHLYCRPDAAGRGLGSQLLDALIELGRASGMDRLYAEASELARPMFLRKGFVLIRRRDFEVRGVLIHNYAMQKILR